MAAAVIGNLLSEVACTDSVQYFLHRSINIKGCLPEKAIEENWQCVFRLKCRIISDSLTLCETQSAGLASHMFRKWERARENFSVRTLAGSCSSG